MILNSEGANLRTNQLRNGRNVTASNPQLTPANSMVFGTGFVTNLYAGTVLNVNRSHSITFDLPNGGFASARVSGLTDVASALRHPQDGDSGGTIFTDIDPGFGRSRLEGILTGGNRYSTQWSFTPFGWINGTFNPRFAN